MGAGFIAYPRNEDVDIADQAENGRADGGVFADAIMIEIAGGMESADLPGKQSDTTAAAQITWYPHQKTDQ